MSDQAYVPQTEGCHGRHGCQIEARVVGGKAEATDFRARDLVGQTCRGQGRWLLFEAS
jgi:hypothetical protein